MNEDCLHNLYQRMHDSHEINVSNNNTIAIIYYAIVNIMSNKKRSRIKIICDKVLFDDMHHNILQVFSALDIVSFGENKNGYVFNDMMSRIDISDCYSSAVVAKSHRAPYAPYDFTTIIVNDNKYECYPVNIFRFLNKKAYKIYR